jgi:hypothetical protein
MLGKGSGVGAGLEPMQPVSANIIRADSTMQRILLFMVDNPLLLFSHVSFLYPV